MDRTEHAGLTMRNELEDALGAEVSPEEPRALVERPRHLGEWVRENRLLATITLGAAVVLGAMASLATGSVVFLVFAVLAHLAVTLVVATFALRLLTQVEKPDPTTVARLQSEGIADPEARLNAALREHAGSRPEAQAEAMTPAGVRTERVGPGRDRALSDV